MTAIIAILIVLSAITAFNFVLVLAMARRLRRLAAELAQRSQRRQYPPLPVGAQVPPFALVATTGARFSTTELVGEPSVVGFFASQCRSCREQVPDFLATVAALPDPGQSLAVIVGDAQAGSDLVAALQPTVRVVVEAEQRGLAALLHVSTFPAFYQLDKDRKVVDTGHSVKSLGSAAHPAHV